MSSVKNTAEFLRNLGLSSNSKPKESGVELAGEYSPKNVVKELFLTPEKEVGNFSGSKRKVRYISSEEAIDLSELITENNYSVSDDDCYLPDKETILQQTGIDEDLRSSKMVVMAPCDEESSEFKRLSEMVDGEVTPGAVIEIDPAKAMKKSSRAPNIVTQLVIFFPNILKQLRYQIKH